MVLPHSRLTIAFILVGAAVSFSAPCTTTEATALLKQAAAGAGIAEGLAQFYSVLHIDNGPLTVQGLTEKWINQAWKETSRMIFSFGSDGDIDEMLTQVKTDGAWRDSAKMFFTLGAQKRITAMKMQSMTKGAWVDAMTMSFTYDANGKLSVLSMAMPSPLAPTQTIEAMRITYTYDEAGKVVKEESGSSLLGTYMVSGETDYTYDANGDCTQELKKQMDIKTGTLRDNSRYTYQYDASHNPVNRLEEAYIDGQWIKSMNKTMTYNAAGKETESIIQSWQNGAWENKELWAKEYDAKGRVTSELYQKWAGGAWVNQNIKTSEYVDTQYWPTRSLIRIWTAGAWADSERTAWGPITVGTIREAMNATASTPAMMRVIGPGVYEISAIPSRGRIAISLADACGSRISGTDMRIASGPEGRCVLQFDDRKLAPGLYAVMISKAGGTQVISFLHTR